MSSWNLSKVLPLSDLTLYNSPERYREEIELLIQVLDLIPEDKYIWNRLCDIYVNTGDFSGAINAAKNALIINPKNKLAWYHISTAFYNKGFIKYSQKGIKNANMPHCIKLFHEDLKYTRCLLAQGFFIQKNYDKTIQIYEKILEKHPKYDYAKFLLGRTYNCKKEYGKAINALKNALEITYEDSIIYGIVEIKPNEQFRENFKIKEELRKKEEIQRVKSAINDELALAHFKKGNYVEAKKSLLEAKGYESKYLYKNINYQFNYSPFIKNVIKPMYEELGFEFKESIVPRKEKKMYDHNDYYNLAEFLAYVTDYDRALKACQRSLKILPNFKKALKLSEKLVIRKEKEKIKKKKRLKLCFNCEKILAPPFNFCTNCGVKQIKKKNK